MKNIENEMLCPICKLSVASDADTLKYCKSCGMNINHDSIIVKRHNRKFYFCSEYCKNIFLKMGFDSFWMNNFHKAI
jgi:YHS domain-containing protein